MNRFFILLVILCATWFLLDNYNKKEVVSQSAEPQTLKKWNRLPSSISGKKECSGPCMSLTVQSSGETSLIDPEDDAVSVSLLKNDQLRMKLVNSKPYDSILTYGSNEADFSNQTLVVNWTLSDIREFTIHQETNQYRYYRTQWRVAGERKFKTVVFSIDSYDVKSPEFVLHYQPYNSGIQQVTFYSLEKNGLSVDSENTAPLVLARNSLLGYEIHDSSKTLMNCLYQAPNGSEENCSAWSKTRMIRSISEQDIGLHKIQIVTDAGRFDFEFRVLSLQ